MTRTSRDTRSETAEKAEGTNQFTEDTKLQKMQSMLRQNEDSFRDITYDADSPTDIPETTVEMMAGEGFKLRWIRYTEGGVAAAKNLRKRRNQGYTFVTRAEVPEMAFGLAGVSNNDLEDDYVILDDLVLAKIPLERAEELSEASIRKSQEQDDAIKVQMEERDVLNRSRTSTKSGGKKSAFASDKK